MALKQAQDSVDVPAGRKNTTLTVELRWNTRATSDQELACSRSTGSACGSEDDKPDREERVPLARTPGYSFLEAQTGFEDLEKLLHRAQPFGTLTGDSFGRQKRTANLLRFPNCRGGERKRRPRLVEEVGSSQPNSCCLLRSSGQMAAFSRLHERFRVAD